MSAKPLPVDKALRQAKSRAKHGDFETARQIYLDLLERFPDNTRARDGLRTLGSRPSAANHNGGLSPEQTNALLSLHNQGRIAEALNTALALAVTHPKDAFLQNFVGVCHAAAGQMQQAVERYERALAIAPGEADIHINLGDALNAMHRPAEAVAHFRRAIDIQPRTARAHNNLGSALIALGDIKAAADSYAKAAEIDPKLADAHANLGLALIKLGRIDEGEQACRRALRIDADFALAHVNLAHAHDARGETEEAIACLRKAIALKPEEPGTYSNLCEIYDRMNRVEEMRATVQDAIAHCTADDPRLLYRQAQIASRDKDHAAARAFLERMPETGMTAAITKGRLNLLGKTCDKLGDNAAAFAWFGRLNGYVRNSAEAAQWTPAAYLGEVEALAASFAGMTQKPWSDARRAGPADPVFLVGFPRSGTTLLDTILRSHPRVAVIEEQPMVQEMRTLLGGAADRECLQALDDEQIAGLRDAYFAALEPHAGDLSDDCLVIDKLPLNIVHAGLIERVFPRARFILALRHPCDCVLSCYMQNFQLNNAMAHFLDLDSSAILYDRAMRLWNAYRTALDLNVHEHRYEELVADFDGAIGRLLAFLGLEWDERMRDYRETAVARGRINTPSYNQVTENLYRSAAGRWENYRTEMAAVLPMLEPWAGRLGYGKGLSDTAGT
ncbi:sulfotransferase [Oricola sp.]|uniref:tetratricopeptide repeat-containing sulfotransferase family protein n=1 Tax=Oricola sp. TaxID=1979950 RepID=UPI003BAC3C71